MDLFLLEPRHIASDLVMILLILNIDLRDSGVILIHRRHIIIKEMIQNRIAKQTIKWNQTTHIKDLFLFIIFFRSPFGSPLNNYSIALLALMSIEC
ncbi:Uncharacterised protein [Bacteroides xylanisolvens]|nr:Uncharacterised protein [Bacteroides xylanisolvens]